MKGIINKLYKEVYEQTEDGQIAIRNVSEETSSALELILDGIGTEHVEDLVFHISSFSQETGFISGFKSAVSLMCECR